MADIIKYRFLKTVNYIKVSDANDQVMYIIPSNVSTYTKLSDQYFQIRIMGENIMNNIIDWRDVLTPDSSSFATIDDFLTSLSAILNTPINDSEWNELGTNGAYFYYTDFDTGALPAGWRQSTSGAGASGVGTQAAESTVIGQWFLKSGVALSGRAAIRYSNTISYLLNFQDSQYTKLLMKIRWDGTIPVTNTLTAFGWTNNVAAVAGAFGNSLLIMYDPSNVSGFNSPTPITNLFLLARTSSYGVPGNTRLDLGVLPSNIWATFEIIYDQQKLEVRVIRNDIVIGTLTNLANVPGGAVRGAIPLVGGASLQPILYTGNSASVAPVTTTGLRIDKVTVYKKFI